jgi:hypothetical protein
LVDDPLAGQSKCMVAFLRSGTVAVASQLIGGGSDDDELIFENSA